MQTPDASSRGATWQPLAICALALLLLAWVTRQFVDRNGGPFSNNEFHDWLTVVGIVTGACLITGLALIRRPLGRCVLLGTILAALTFGVGLLGEVLFNSA